RSSASGFSARAPRHSTSRGPSFCGRSTTRAGSSPPPGEPGRPRSRSARPPTLRKEPAMQLGMIGLGRMGANMVRRLVRADHECVAFDLDPDAVKQLAGEGAVGAESVENLVEKLQPPRAIW